MLIQQLAVLIFLLQPLQTEIRPEHTPAGNIIERTHYSNMNCMIRWGNKQFMRSLPDTFSSIGLNSPYFWYENGRFILLKVNYKEARSSVFVLPLNDSAKVVRIKDPFVFDVKTNLLACIQSPRSVKFVNIASGKTGSINVPLPRGSKDLLFSINSAILTDTKLQIHWIDTPPSAYKVFRIPKLK